MPRVRMQDLTDFGTGLLVEKGVPRDRARYVAGIAVRTEAMGVSTHGAVIFGFFDKSVGPAIDPKAEPEVIEERTASALIDGNRAFGQLSMKLASEIAVRKAREHGAAVVGARNTFWIAGLGVYLLPLAREGFLAQLWAQSSTCKDCAPHGGIDARFSTNPVAVAFPTGGDPVFADFSTATMSMGKVSRLARQEKRAPAPVFVGKGGSLTDDPNAVLEGGSMLFMGGQQEGYKGYALSLWCEALTALAGGDCNNPEAESRQCFNLTVIDPQAFAGAEYYRKEMKRFIGHVKSSRPRPGFGEVRLPGERALARLREAEKSGIDMDPLLLDTLGEVARSNGLEPLKVEG